MLDLSIAEILQQCGYSLSESAASRLHASSPGMWTEMVQRSLLRVFPNGSRVDSSNFSPLEFWNAGVPMGKSSNGFFFSFFSILLDDLSIERIPRVFFPSARLIFLAGTDVNLNWAWSLFRILTFCLYVCTQLRSTSKLPVWWWIYTMASSARTADADTFSSLPWCASPALAFRQALEKVRPFHRLSFCESGYIKMLFYITPPCP